MESPRPVRLKRENNEEKIRILEAAKEIGIRKASRLYSVSRSNIQRWIKQEKEIKTAVGNKRGKKKNTCKMTSMIKYPEMELLLEQWILDQRTKGIAIIGVHIKKKARELVEELTGDTTFKASDGWIQRFKRRHHWGIRRRSTR